MDFCSCICGSSMKSSVVHPEDSYILAQESNRARRFSLEECPMCLETITRDSVFKCANPVHPHPHHRHCVESYSAQIPEGAPVFCSLKCGYVFENVLGTKNVEESNLAQDAGPQVQVDWDRINAAIASGLVRNSRTTQRYLESQSLSEQPDAEEP